MLEEEIPSSSALRPWLVWYLDVLQKHTTVDPTPSCLSRRRIVKMIYFKLWVLYFHTKNPCVHMLPVAFGKQISNTRNRSEISWNPSPISRFPSPKIRFSSPKIQFPCTKSDSPKSAFYFLQWLSAFSNGFPLSPTAFQISPKAFRFSSTAFRFPRNPRKSMYGEKYTKFCYPSFVFFATRSPSFVIPAKQYLRLTQHSPLPSP